MEHNCGLTIGKIMFHGDNALTPCSIQLSVHVSCDSEMSSDIRLSVPRCAGDDM